MDGEEGGVEGSHRRRVSGRKRPEMLEIVTRRRARRCRQVLIVARREKGPDRGRSGASVLEHSRLDTPRGTRQTQGVRLPLDGLIQKEFQPVLRNSITL